MATAEEILMAEATEETITIDPDLRTINIPSTIKLLGVEGDTNTNSLYFRAPKTHKGIDLSTFDIQINYVNGKKQPGVYYVTDKAVVDNNITFSWLVDRFAAQHPGSVSFIVSFRKYDAGGWIERSLNTAAASLPIEEGNNPGDHLITSYPDLYEELLKRLEPITHKLEGTTLTITSSSGSTSIELKGEKGEPGEPGGKGDKGDPGDKGDRGEVGPTGRTGKSLLDYLREAGYNGTEQEFKDSISSMLSMLQVYDGTNEEV